MKKHFTNLRLIKARILAVITLLIGMLTLPGCQTVKGAGKDIEKAGEHIQNSADKHS